MSQYYRPRQSQRGPSPHSSVAREQEREQLSLQIDLEDSIYVFPNPSSSAGSSPLSPSLGSDISAPTDLTLSRPSGSRSRSRNSSDHGSFSQTKSISGRMPTNIGRRISVGVDGDPEVEIWDWNTDMDTSVAVSEESAVGLEDVDRTHRWNVLVPRRNHSSRRDPFSSSSLWRARQQQLDYVTSRTASVPRSTHRRHRSVDSVAGSIADHSRIRIQMLSFIASLLFIDEATIRLLTHPSSESALFLGHSYSDEHPSDEHDGPPHGAAKLLAGSDEKQTLKEGLAIACDPSVLPFNPFALPRPSGLWDLVNGVWTNSGRAWREVWT